MWFSIKAAEFNVRTRGKIIPTYTCRHVSFYNMSHKSNNVITVPDEE